MKCVLVPDDSTNASPKCFLLKDSMVLESKLPSGTQKQRGPPSPLDHELVRTSKIWMHVIASPKV